jgi:hypothetical protein
VDDLTSLLARIEVLERESAEFRARLEDWETAGRIFGLPHPDAAPARHLSLVRPA